MANLSNPINLGQFQPVIDQMVKKVESLTDSLPAPIPTGLKMVGGAAASIVGEAVDSRIFEPLKYSLPLIDARYQDKIAAALKDRSFDLTQAAVKDWLGWKVGAPLDIVGIDHNQTGRTDDLIYNLFGDTGMPHWMSLGAAAEFAWHNGNPKRSRAWEDEMNAAIGTPVNTQVSAALAFAYSHWDGRDANGDAPGDAARQAAWLDGPMQFSATMPGSGGLSGAGLNFYRAATSQAIADGVYTSEKQLFFDAVIQPAGSTLPFWRSLSHDLWVNSAQYKQELDAANAKQTQINAELFAAKTTEPSAQPSFLAGLKPWQKAAGGAALVGIAYLGLRK